MADSSGKWIDEYKEKLFDESKGLSATGWLVSYEWLLYQIVKGINDPDQKGLLICIKEKEGKFLDPSDKYELCIRGVDEKGELAIREEFPPIKWP